MKVDKQYLWILTAAFILVGVICIVIVVGLLLPEQQEPIEGMVELTDYRISSKVPSRVLALRVTEGQEVHKGDTLVLLQAPEVEAKLTQAQSARSAAQAMEDKAQNGTRYEQVQMAFEMWQKARAGLVIAEKTYRRVASLCDEGVVPVQKKDEAIAQYKSMQQTVKAAKSQYDMAQNGARVEDKLAAQAQVRQAQGAISEVKSYLRETVFTSPVDGYITEIFPEVSELVGTGAPIMNVVDTHDAWFTFNIREDKLPGITIGKHMHVFLPALNKTIPVRISLMKNVGNFATWKATKSMGQYDLKTFEVQARPLHYERGLQSAMSVILKP